MVRIKICCMASIEEARMAIEAGASAVGLVGKMPSGPGPIPDALIAAIARSVPPPISTFLLTSEQTTEGIASHYLRVRTSTIQIVDAVSDDTLKELRRRLPGVKLVPVVHVTGKESLEEALRLAPHADALLLDSGRPNLAVKELGGTGRTHDWRLSRRIRDSISCPVFLAGGLGPGNVAEAIRAVHPFAVDVCSGVRTNGALDAGKLRAFCHAVAKGYSPH